MVHLLVYRRAGLDKQRNLSKRKETGNYMYFRRVPRVVAGLFGKAIVKISLGTKDVVEAAAAARRLDAEHEALWASLLVERGQEGAWARYNRIVMLAQSLGFEYLQSESIANQSPVAEIGSRLERAVSSIGSVDVVSAVLGGDGTPVITLSGLLDAYLERNAVSLSGKSAAQFKKHKSQRSGSLKVAVEVIGDIPLAEVTREKVAKYKKHWSARVLSGEVTRESANRSMSDMKGMLSVIDDDLETSYGDAWGNIRIKGKKQTKDKRRRHPYPAEFIKTKLLAPEALAGLNEQARYSVYGMVETGMGPSEICNLRKEDIRLDDPIPHVRVAERDDREQKTVYRIREIPLVGVSLWAFKQCPEGFPRYHDKGTALSAVINKYLKENDLRPSLKHSIYSLRHNFQDRMTAAGANDRLQVDLMGHELGRQAYGEGASLEQKLELLDRIKFDWTPPS